MANGRPGGDRLRIFLLGGLRVEWDGAALPETTWRRPQARTLIKLLATERTHRLHREQLVELFWPDHDPDAAAGNLRRLLYLLRRSLPDGAQNLIEQRNELVALDAARVWIDADAFEDAAQAALGSDTVEALERALTLYGGELLPGERYSQWAEGRREDLAGLQRALLFRLAGVLAQRLEPAAAIERLRQVLALDPAHEAAHRELMRLQAASGNRGEALRQYEICREALAGLVGVEPDAETETLRRQIEAGSVSAPVLPLAAARPWRTPLIGRERALELALLPPIPRATNRAAPAGEPAAVVLVRGEAGVGKTRLAAEAAREAGRRGCLVLWGTCAARAAYAPFVEALEQYAGGLTASERKSLAAAHPEIARIIPSLEPPAPLPPMEAGGDELRLFAAVARVLTQLTAVRPAIVVIDDLQLADDATLALLAYLARLPDTRRNWLILGTYRVEEARTGSTLAATLDELQRTLHCRQVNLLPLGRQECVRLVESVLGGPVQEAAGDHIFRTSLGNPLFAVELLGALRSSGDLISSEAGWHLVRSLTGPPGIPVPDQVAGLIATRIAALNDDTRKLLALAAVTGMSAPLAVLERGAQLMGQGADVYLDGLERAVEARLLLEEQGAGTEASVGTFSFQHPLFREVVYAQLGVARRTHLHGVAARATEAVRPADVEALAYHYGHSSDREKHIVYLERAGDRARSIYANALAESHYRTLLSLLEPGSPAIPRVQTKLGAVLNLTARHGEALELLEAAAAAFEATSHRDDVGNVVAAIGLTHAAQGTPEAAIGRLEEALCSLDGVVQPVTLAGIAIALAHVFYACGRYARSLAAAERAGGLSLPCVANPEGRRIHAQAEVRRAAALNMCGHRVEAQRVLEAALPEVEASGDLDNLIRALNNLGTAAQQEGDFAAHQRHQRQALEIAERLGDPARIAVYRAALGQAALFTRDWGMPESLTLAEEGYRELKALGQSWHTAYAALYLGWILLWLGRWEEARPVLEESVALAGQDRQALIITQVLLSDIELLEGQAETARGRLEPLLAANEEEDDLDGTLVCANLARVLSRLGERERALMLADRAVRRARRMGHPLYVLETLLARGNVGIECGAWSSAESDLCEALTLARRIGHGAREAASLFFLGQVKAARGDVHAAERLFAASRGQMVRLGGEGAARGIDAFWRTVVPAGVGPSA